MFEDVQDYEATIGYSRTMKSYIDTMFQIFDCGGKESFISAFIGDQAGFIFSDVVIFIWVVDMNNFDVVSTSRFYFNHGVTNLKKYSPDARIYCFFHKKDLFAPENQDQAATTLMQFLRSNPTLKSTIEPLQFLT